MTFSVAECWVKHQQQHKIFYFIYLLLTRADNSTTMKRSHSFPSPKTHIRDRQLFIISLTGWGGNQNIQLKLYIHLYKSDRGGRGGSGMIVLFVSLVITWSAQQERSFSLNHTLIRCSWGCRNPLVHAHALTDTLTLKEKWSL